MSDFCSCWQSWLRNSLCARCLSRLRSSFYPRSVYFELDGALPLLAMSRYEEGMREFVYVAKSGRFNGLMPAQIALLRELALHWAEELRDFSLDFVVPVPGHPWRTLLQNDLAWIFARYLSHALGLPEPRSILKRRLFLEGNFYSAQKSLKRRERREHIRRQFYVPPSRGERRRLLLVDDVCTTGASLNLSRRILEDAGYRVEAACVLSRVESPAAAKDDFSVASPLAPALKLSPLWGNSSVSTNLKP